MAANASAKKFFLNKRFYLHVKSRAESEKAAECIRVFGGQIDLFLDNSVSYVLTDVPKIEWPPNGIDETLQKARSMNVKLMSLSDLLIWCSQYISSQSSSDEDDELRANINELREPFIKFEDLNCYYAPTVKELVKWPEINLSTSIPLGRSIFSDSSLLSTPNQSTNNILHNHPNNSAQITQQAASLKTNNLMINATSTSTANQPPPSPLANPNQVNGVNGVGAPLTAHHVIKHVASQSNINHPISNQQQNVAQRMLKRRNPVYCEICNLRITDKIEDHIKTASHRANIERVNWNEVSSVIKSLPSFTTLNKRRITSITPTNSEQEFFCLHKVESVSQIFYKDFQPLSPLVDKKLVHIQ